MQARESRLISKRQQHRVRYLFVISFWFLAFLPLSGRAIAQSTSFTYQGKLSENGSPANGVYLMEFRLFDALSAGSQQGSTITLGSVTVTNGIFAVTLDF